MALTEQARPRRDQDAQPSPAEPPEDKAHVDPEAPPDPLGTESSSVETPARHRVAEGLNALRKRLEADISDFVAAAGLKPGGN